MAVTTPTLAEIESVLDRGAQALLMLNDMVPNQTSVNIARKMHDIRRRMAGCLILDESDLRKLRQPIPVAGTIGGER